MNIAHKQMEACGYISEIFELDSVYKQEVSFSPVVYSFFPERSDREKIVELMMVIIENYEERPHDCFSQIGKLTSHFNLKMKVMYLSMHLMK